MGVVFVPIMPGLVLRGVRGRRAEEALVFRQESQDEASGYIGPEDGGLDGGAGVICQGLEAEAGEGTQDGEEGQVGDRVDFGLEAGTARGSLVGRKGGGTVALIFEIGLAFLCIFVDGGRGGNFVEVGVIVGLVVGVAIAAAEIARFLLRLATQVVRGVA